MPTIESPACVPSLADLRDHLRAAGLGRPAPYKTYFKFFLMVFAAFGAMGWAVAHPEITLAGQGALCALGGWFLTSAAMCGHDGAHGATSSRAWVNNLVAQLGFTLLGGLAVTYWRHKHNSLHHPQVNVAKRDPDVEQSLLALSVRQHGEQGGVVRWLQKRFQGPVFWLVGCPLVLVDLKVTSLRFVARALWRGHDRPAALADLAWLIAHYALWLLAPLAFWPFTTALAVYGFSVVVCGFFLAFIFAPAHIPYPVVRESHDPLLLQLASTRNFRTNWFFRLTLIGLDRQIEHHLAPKLPHFQLEAASHVVRKYCARHGLPYNETGWGRAILDTHTSVRDGWRIDEVVIGAPA
jgi:fatty acid desaturase